MPLRARVAGGRRRSIKERQRLGGAFALQQFGGEVEPRAGIARLALDGFQQQRLGRLRLAGDAHEGGEIGACRWMARRANERLAHGRLGVLDVTFPVARDAVIDPGVRPGGVKLQRLGKGSLGLPVSRQGEPDLTIEIMRGR